jgi:UMF1 family MFS transporter
MEVSTLKGNKKIIRAWTIYDWANSVYQLSITSAILPAYYGAVAAGDSESKVQFFGFSVVNTTLYAWTVSFSFLVVAILSPLLSSIADYTGRRKLFMQIFTYIGGLGCASLYFFNKSNLEFGIIAFAFASIGYSGSLVFYNAWLPEIAEHGEEDKISARGFALGYIGGVVLLVFNLTMLLKPEFFGLSRDGSAARISFLTVGIWWLSFAQYTFYYLPKRIIKENKSKKLLLQGYKELKTVWRQFNQFNYLKLFLVSFFFTMMGVLTVMYMAANFGKKELGLQDEVLIPTILIIQIVGVVGALAIAWLSKKYGNAEALIFCCIIWFLICVAAYFVYSKFSFIILASFVGFVMGGVQALARSTYAKLIPHGNDNTSYFSFYDVCEKIAVVTGTFLFGLLEQLTGSMRTSIVLLGLLFLMAIVGWGLLMKLKLPEISKQNKL